MQSMTEAIMHNYENPVNSYPNENISPLTLIDFDPSGIPDELTELRQWVAFEITPTGNPAKPLKKMPIDPQTGGSAEVDNPATWGSLDDAITRACKLGRHGALGFAFVAGGGLFGIDRDGCRDPETGKLDDNAAALIATFGTYAEPSVSGTGIHAVGRGTLPSGRRRSRKGELKIEIYDRGRFFIFTGKPITGYTAIQSCQETLDSWHAATLSEPERPKVAQPVTPITSDTEDVLKAVLRTDKGRRLYESGWQRCGYESWSDADLAFCNLLYAAHADQTQADDLFRRSALMRPKWDERRGDSTYGAQTLNKAFDGTVRKFDSPFDRSSKMPDRSPIPKIDDLPNDVAELRRVVVDLTQRLELAERRIEAAERRATIAEDRAQNLSLLQSRTMSAFRSKRLGSEKATGVALAFELLNQQTADPTREEFVITHDRLAEQTGASESTIANHVKDKLQRVADSRTGEIVELFERRIRFVPGDYNPTTGVRSEAKSQSVYIPKLPPLEMLDILAHAVPISGKAKNNHGGRADRGRLCPDHPHADIVKKVTYHCSECDRLLDQDAPVTLPAEDIAAEDIPNTQDAGSVPNVDPTTSVVNVYRSTKLATYHNDVPGSIAEAWQHGQPLPGMTPTPGDRWTT